ncbi:MAG: hypothetical protein CMH34_01085 [Microbacterium sp.]|nr:hypothetical protein [Microbacterium sp.]
MSISADPKTHDLFVSHASEDKDGFVRPLVAALERLGFNIWYDETTLIPGMSLSGEIDRGLSESKFGVVVLSPAFFEKSWPKHELAGLRARQMDGQNIIIPIWHGLSRAEILKHSPPLADMLAFNSDDGIDHIVERLEPILNPDINSIWLLNCAREVGAKINQVEPIGSEFDYWPNGGLRNIYNRVINFITYPQFIKKYGKRIWISGPHDDRGLNLRCSNDFGHYDPEFVNWLYNNVESILNKPSFVKLTKYVFDLSLGRLSALYYASYEFLRLNPAIAESLRSRFANRLDNNELEPSHYYELAWASGDEYEGGIPEMMRRLSEAFDGNMAASAVYFWVRRIEDGTAPLFAKIVGLLVQRYGLRHWLNNSIWDLSGLSAEYGGSFPDWQKFNKLLEQHMDALIDPRPTVTVSVKFRHLIPK